MLFYRKGDYLQYFYGFIKSSKNMHCFNTATQSVYNNIENDIFLTILYSL